MSSTRSIISPPPFAANALTVIPPTPVAGVSYRDPAAGPASSPDGWPYAERVNSAEFNQIMFQLSSLLSILDVKGILGWSDQVDYTQASTVFASNGLRYDLLQSSGPNAGGAKDPISNPTYWKPSRSGSLIRTTVYRNVGGVLQSSIDGAAFATASSTFTAQGATAFVMVQTIGGGGGGGGAAPTGSGQTSNGSGGGAGGYAKSKITSGFSGVSISAGAGGTAGAGVAGGNGGTSSFGVLLSSAGGQGGPLGMALPATTTAPVGQSNGGTSTGGNMINSTGSTGKSAFYSANNISGAGGDSVFGGGAPFVSGTSSGQAAVSPGCGGSGGALGASSGSPAGGGAGFYGLVIIEEYE